MHFWPSLSIQRSIRRSIVCSFACFASIALLNCVVAIANANNTDFAQLDAEYVANVQPLLEQYCLDCHASDGTKSELDLERFQLFKDVRGDVKSWQSINEMLAQQEMPPKESPQLNTAEAERLKAWIDNFLNAEALATAGDPGPVILRRLSNAEFNYSIRDVTGIDSLDPTREFPIDGAAGEGFTNTGSAQAMSPSLVEKYLDASKSIAEHLVLLPDGIEFSQFTTKRDQSDDLVRRIQEFYSRFTSDGGGQPVDLQGIKFDTNEGGRLPLVEYLAATVEKHAALDSGSKSIEQVASERSLNAKYLSSLWNSLASNQTSGTTTPSLMTALRERWRSTHPADLEQLVQHIKNLQQALWKYNSIGHIGRDGTSVPWLEAVNPIVAEQELSLALEPVDDEDLPVFLLASPIGASQQQGIVVWENPRLVGGDQPDIPLRQVAGLQKRIQDLRKEALAKADQYLAVAAEISSAPIIGEEGLATMAARKHLDAEALHIWLSYLRLTTAGPVRIEGHFSEQLQNEQYSFIRGWGSVDTPSILANSSDEQVRIPGIARPHGIVVHPSPSEFVAVGWQSPIDGSVRIETSISDAHPECGNGQEWSVDHRSANRTNILRNSVFPTGGSATTPIQAVSVKKGDVLSLIIGPQAGNHSCDLTDINLIVSEAEGEKRVWNLAEDCSPNVLSANPHPDALGNPHVWHFYHGENSPAKLAENRRAAIPAGSLIAAWKVADDPSQRAAIAVRVRQLMESDPPEEESSPDRHLYEQLRVIPLPANRLNAVLATVDSDERFGRHPSGQNAKESDLVVETSAIQRFLIPAELACGRTLMVTGRLHDSSDSAAEMRISTTAELPGPAEELGTVVATASSSSYQRVLQEFADVRDLFPPSLCYVRIVPVDEVVTLTLYYRQDEHLKRLMLDDAQSAQLDRLWDELLYVAQEPLKYQVAFEQIREFATQDRPDLVSIWQPLIKSVDERAEAFRNRLVDTEPAHLEALLGWADRLWRRSLNQRERERVLELYGSLRDAELTHEESIRLTFARLIASPAFLYRHEHSPAGVGRTRVSSSELVSRLSYFLWSSLPDESLRNAADANFAEDDSALRFQARRLLSDPRSRRLAEQFACQWLHVRDFDQTVEKNEKLFPGFTELRSDMNEETVRFFEDMFRNDRSILNMLDADYTFVSPALAEHYDLQDTQATNATGWQRVEGVRIQGRGGVLGMATVLASQSGASRTSPILRGNWVYETILGERLPRPPAGVPQLPDQPVSGLSERELIEQHSADASCAKCHDKIDPFGFALEQFDAVGQVRENVVDTKTTLLGGREIEGLQGLREYLLTERLEDFVRQFCRKLLGYALGRELLLSDNPLIETMHVNLAENHYRFSAAVETIVLSEQFRSIRGRDVSDE